ncbi:MAG: hypothetical protein MUC45_02300 [Actinomycetia bacterium]|nr:hypothetical protein [Actinomycetes bacterium]
MRADTAGPARAARLRVQVSLDPTDLPTELAAVRAALDALHVDVLPAGAERPGPADVFVGVYGDSYGAIRPDVGLSRLEEEYLAAGSRPRLIYVRADRGVREAHLTVLLARIQADDLTSYRRFRDADELGTLLADDLAVLLTETFAERLEHPEHPEHGHIPPPRAPSSALGTSTGRRLPRSRIPAPWHRIVGRERELDELQRLLGSGLRLVTLTGPGGIGKSRLAIEVARRVEISYPDGVWFVDLAGIRDPALLAPTIAHALGVRESAGVSPVQSLKTYLAGMRALLLLDCFETVAAAAPLVVDLLAAAPGVQAVVTSRSVLRVRGEQEYPLAPLALPAGGHDGPALELFLERVAAANPGLRLDAPQRAAAAEICRRLEGVPLALELAAARTRVLPPSVLLGRLTRALDELTGGPVDLPERQRTLRTTIDWDHELLGIEEQVLFRRLAVFPRRFTMDSAAAVIGDAGLDVLDALDALVGKSLLRAVDPRPSGEPRFMMLEAVHEYAAERLAESGDAEEVARRHAAWFLDLAERAALAPAAEEGAAMALLEEEHDDLRAALAWAERSMAVETLVRLAAALGRFWGAHCHFSEGRRWLDRALGLTVGHRTRTRVALLEAAAVLARARGEYDTAEQLYREQLGILEELGDAPVEVAHTLRYLGNVAFDRGDLAGARRLWQDSLAALEQCGDPTERMGVVNNLGVIAHLEGDQHEAIRRYEEALALAARTGDAEAAGRYQMNLGLATSAAGDHARGAELCRAGVRAFAELQDTWDLVDALESLAMVLGAAGEVDRAAWLFGGSAALRAALDVPRPAAEEEVYAASRAGVRAADPARFDAAESEGGRAALDDIIDVALATGPAVPR